MKAGGGKAKGAAFEREVCRDLSRFVDPKGTDTLFWRSAMSGGRATMQNRKGDSNQTQLGDITCVHPEGHWLTEYFVIECKFWKDLNLESSLLFGKGKLAAFWHQLQTLALKKRRHPLLIAKQNNTPTLVIMTAQGLQQFKTFKQRSTRVLVYSSTMGRGLRIVCLYDEVFK